MPVGTHYDTLKIKRDAPPEVIRAVYKALAQKYHPDRNVGNAEAVQMMQMINDAYRTLADEKKKADHDAWIRQKDPPPPPPPLTPREQELKNKSDACAADAKKWADYAAKMAGEARIMRDKAEKVAAQGKAAPPDKRAAFDSLYAREDAAAKAEDAKAQDAAKKAQAAADIAAKNAFIKDAKGPATHYDTLKIVFDAPPEVIEAAARALSQKYQAENRTTEMSAVTNAVAVLTDIKKKMEHDDWARKQMPKEQAKAQTERKPTGRELEAQARAEKLEAEANALNALADRLMKEEKAASEKAAQAAKDAQARAKDQDAAKWKAWAEKTAAEAAHEKNRSAKAAATAAAASLKAQQARKEVEDAKAAADREAALWSDKGK